MRACFFDDAKLKADAMRAVGSLFPENERVRSVTTYIRGGLSISNLDKDNMQAVFSQSIRERRGREHKSDFFVSLQEFVLVSVKE